MKPHTEFTALSPQDLAWCLRRGRRLKTCGLTKNEHRYSEETRRDLCGLKVVGFQDSRHLGIFTKERSIK